MSCTETERKFSLAKRCYGLGLVRTKLDTTTRSSIYLSIIEMNIDMLTSISLHEFLTSHYLIFGEIILWRQSGKCCCCADTK